MHCATAAIENSVSAPRQPPSASAAGTATSEATAAPPLMPVVHTPLANAGRSGKRSLTAIGSSAPAIAMPMPNGSVSRSSERRAGRGRAGEPEQRDRGDARRDYVAQPAAAGQRRGRGREHAHAQHGDRAEQAGHRVRDAEVALDLRQQRSGADELRSQRQRGDEQRRQEDQPTPLGDYGRTITFSAPSRRSVNVA